MAKRSRASTKPTKSPPPKRAPRKQESGKKGNKKKEEEEVEEEEKKIIVSVASTKKRRASSKVLEEQALPSAASVAVSGNEEVRTTTGLLTSLEIHTSTAPKLGRTLSMHHSTRVESFEGKYDAERDIVHMAGDFVAIHTTEAPFWLAKLDEPITQQTTPDDSIAIVWLEHVVRDEYKKGADDTILAGAVMIAVQMLHINHKRYFLHGDSKRTLLIHLERQTLFDQGQIGALEEEDLGEGDDDSEEEEEEIKEASARAPSSASRKTTSKRKTKRAVERADDQEGSAEESAGEDEEDAKPKRKARARKTEEGGEGIKSAKKKPAARGKKAVLKLEPNTSISLLPDSFLQKGPFRTFDGDNQRANKEVIRALLSGERGLLEQIVERRDIMYTLHIRRSVNCDFIALHYAIVRNDEAAIRLLLSEARPSLHAGEIMPSPQHVSMEVIGSGNHTSRFSNRNRRAVQASRGGMEGNNALAKELRDGSYPHASALAGVHAQVLAALLEPGVKLETFQLLMTLMSAHFQFDNHLHEFVQRGRIEIAGYLVGVLVKSEGFGFNKLHEQVLRNRQKEPLEKFLKVSVAKKPVGNSSIRPTHCAAINPNHMYLKQLLDTDPAMLRVNDDERSTLMHYAAVNASSGCLKMLLGLGLGYNEPNAKGQTPLMWAASENRVENIRELIKAASVVASSSSSEGEGKEGEMREGEEGEEAEEKVVVVEMSGDARKKALLAVKLPDGLNALHMACQKGHLETIKALVEEGADIECKTAAAPYNSFSPFLFACQQGHLEAVKLLESLGANLAGVDKLNKTGVVIATQEGHIHIVSYLLRAGVNPNVADSSGNTALMYAAAYGWDDILELLVDGGADLNHTNTWKLSALSAASGLGRYACVNSLLARDVDVNVQDATGKTLLIDLCSSLEVHRSLTVIKKLLEKESLNVNIQDADGHSAMHMLAKCSSALAAPLALEAAQLLLNHKADVLLLNTQGLSPLILAVRNKQIEMGKLLLRAGAKLRGEDQKGKNLLHHLMSLALFVDVQSLMEIVQKETNHTELLEFTLAVDDNGFTPLLTLFQLMSTWDLTKEHYNTLPEPIALFLPRMLLLVSAFPSESRAVTVQQLKLARTDPKIEPKWPTEGGYSVLHFLATFANREVCEAVSKLVLEYSEINNEEFLNRKDVAGHTALHKTMHRQSQKQQAVFCEGFVQQLLQTNKIDVDSCDKQIENNTPMHCAVLARDLKLVDILRKAKANIDIRDQTLRTPLHLAVILDDISLTQFLLTNKANVECVDEENRTPLHFAVNNCTSSADASFEMERLLLSYNANVNAKDKYLRLPIHYAFIKMHMLDSKIPVKKRIREAQRCTLYSRKHTGLSSAATFTHDPIETISSLCSIKGIELFEKDENKNSPMHFACIVGAAACFSYLLKRAQNQNELEETDIDGNTPLGLALVNKQPNFAIMIIQKGPNVNHPIAKVERDSLKFGKETSRITHSMFHEAISQGWQGVAYLLLDAGYAYTNAIQDALVSEKFQLVLTLLAKLSPRTANDMSDEKETRGGGGGGESLKDVADAENNTLLHYLAKTRTQNNFDNFSLRIAKDLIVKGINVKQKAKDLRTALHWSVLNLHNHLTQFLLSCNVSAQDIDSLKQTPFSLLMQHIRKRSAASKDDTNKGGIFVPPPVVTTTAATSKTSTTSTGTTTPPPFATLSSSDISGNTCAYIAMKLLLKGKADINYVFPEMFKLSGKPKRTTTPYATTTALIRAIRAKHDFFVKFLLHHGASLYVHDSNGYSPLAHAVIANNLTLVDQLLTYAKTKTSSSSSSSSEQKQAAITDIVDVKGKSLVHFCVSTSDFGSYENTDMLRLLVAHGCSVNHADNEGKTPLFYAMQQASGVMKKALLEHGAKEADVAPIIERQTSGIFQWPVSEVDFEKDAQTMRAKLEEEGSEKKKHVPPAVNRCIDYPASKHVLEEDEEEEKIKEDIKPKAKKVSVKKGKKGKEAEEKTEEGKKDGDVEMTEKAKEKGEERKTEEKTSERGTEEEKKEGSEEKKEQVKRYYDCLLTKVNLKHGTHGENEFYRMQIVQDKVSLLFILFTNWGRVGETGKYQQTPYSDKHDCIVNFKKVFKSKTGNVWGVLPFVKIPKKYSLKEIERTEFISANVIKNLVSPKEEAKQREEGVLTEKECAKSKLPLEVQNTLFMFTGTAMASASKREGVDMPLGRLKRETLEKASGILLQIKASLTTAAELRTVMPLDTAAVLAEAEKLVDLSSMYYELIPKREYFDQPIRPFTMHTLQTESNLLTSLMNLEIAAKMVLAAQLDQSKMHPLDYCYKALDVNLEPLRANDQEYKAILKYSHLKNTKSTEIESIYRVQRKGEAEQMLNWKDTPNHLLLWHGTQSFNVVGILRQGLRVAPPEAPMTGYMFGKGIYFADALAKSLPYCGTFHGTRSFLFLCEVALGAMYELSSGEYMEKAKEGTLSTKGIGKMQPRPEDSIVLTNGVKVPLGEPEDKAAGAHWYGLSHNEYIVYDPTQVRIRYVVQVKPCGLVDTVVAPSLDGQENDSENGNDDSEAE